MAVISLKFTKALDAQLTEQAHRRRLSKSELVRRALTEFLQASTEGVESAGPQSATDRWLISWTVARMGQQILHRTLLIYLTSVQTDLGGVTGYTPIPQLVSAALGDIDRAKVMSEVALDADLGEEESVRVMITFWQSLGLEKHCLEQ